MRDISHFYYCIPKSVYSAAYLGCWFIRYIASICYTWDRTPSFLSITSQLVYIVRVFKRHILIPWGQFLIVNGAYGNTYECYGHKPIIDAVKSIPLSKAIVYRIPYWWVRQLISLWVVVLEVSCTRNAIV